MVRFTRHAWRRWRNARFRGRRSEAVLDDPQITYPSNKASDVTHYVRLVGDRRIKSRQVRRSSSS